MKELYIQSIFNQYLGKRDEAMADLDVYLNNPTAIGEHSDIGAEIRKKIQEVDKYSSLVGTMEKIFTQSDGTSSPPESS